MKRMIMMLLCMVFAAAPVLADGYQDHMSIIAHIGGEIKFTQRDFYGGQSLPVYYGPGKEYGRGANGWAKALTDEPLYAAGKENGWVLVMYGTSGGSVRVGWVDLSQFKYDTSILKLQNLRFQYRTVRIKTDCILTDDPVLDNRDLGYLYSGTKVTYLGSFYKYREWAYIETWMDDHPIRAFVPMECISM